MTTFAPGTPAFARQASIGVRKSKRRGPRSGAEIDAAASAAPTAQWAHVQAGPWLAEALESRPRVRRVRADHPGHEIRRNGPRGAGFSRIRWRRRNCLILVQPSAPRFRTPRAFWRPLSLSEIKSDHADGVIRREFVSEECTWQPEHPVVPAHP
jgi:hypothetical protein